MTDAEIEAVFGSAPAGTELAADARAGNDAAVVVLLVMATISVALRLASRPGSISRAGIRADDYMMVAALLFCAGTAGMTFAGGAYGAGTHVWTLNMPKVSMIFKILFSYTFIYAAAVSSTKLSILLLYYRIFGRNAGTVFLVCLGAGGCLAISYPIVVWATMATSCRPLSYFWERFAGTVGTCIAVDAFFLALGIINMLNDVIVLVMPIPPIWRLQMSLRRSPAGPKADQVSHVYHSVCVASIVRIHYLSVFMGAVDVTYAMGPVLIWSSVEPSVGILSACLPCFPPLVRWFRPRAEKSSTGSGTPGGIEDSRVLLNNLQLPERRTHLGHTALKG